MNSLKDVKQSCRAILGDPEGQFATDAYLVPLINHVYGLIILDLSDTCSPYITKVVVVPAIQPGTSDLTQFGATPDDPLYGLINVLHEGVDWKIAGSPDVSYKPVTQVDKLPSTQPRTVAIDLRVRGEFRPAPLLKDTDLCAIHPLMSYALAEQVGACAMRERANPGQMSSYQLEGSDILDDIKNQLVRSQQGTSIKLGRLSGRGRGNRGYGYWYTSPNFFSPMMFEFRAYVLFISP